MYYLYKLGDVSRSVLSKRNIIIYMIFLIFCNISISMNTRSGSYGTVLDTTPSEFFEVDKVNPYKVKSTCTVTIAQPQRENKQIIDSGCKYKPGDTITRYSGSLGSLRGIIKTVVFLFIIVVLLAIALPQHPTIKPRQQ